MHDIFYDLIFILGVAYILTEEAGITDIDVIKVCNLLKSRQKSITLQEPSTPC